MKYYPYLAISGWLGLGYYTIWLVTYFTNIINFYFPLNVMTAEMTLTNVIEKMITITN